MVQSPVQLPSPAISKQIRVVLLTVLALACLHPAISSATGLILGLVFGVVLAHPAPDFNKQWVHRFLAWSIVGIGAGMDLQVLAKVGISGIAYTFLGITLTLAVGSLLGRWLKSPAGLSVLICSGTAIC